MLEIVFGENASGSLSVAIGTKRWAGGTFGIIMNNAKKPSQKEIKKLLKEAEEQERYHWSQAIPLEGNRKDIIPLSLALSIGEINEIEIGAQRETALKKLQFPIQATEDGLPKKTIETARKNMMTLLERVQKGESIRIWSSDQPDEACGLYWLMAYLQTAGLKELDITLVKLPDFDQQPDGTVIQFLHWGEVAPYQWGRMAKHGKKLHPNHISAMAAHWKELQKENAPLRAMVNGQLVSVPETFYDSFILREIAAQTEEFTEAAVIGTILSKYQLGIGDAWIALRIEHLIQNGVLIPISQPNHGKPIYCRILQKCNC